MSDLIGRWRSWVAGDFGLRDRFVLLCLVFALGQVIHWLGLPSFLFGLNALLHFDSKVPSRARGSIGNDFDHCYRVGDRNLQTHVVG